MATVLPVYGGPLKRALVQMAFEEAGQADYNYQIQPEEYDSALRKLNALMGEWLAEGIDLGYNFPTSNVGSPDDESGIPDTATQVVSLSLGWRLFPSLGKTASAETRASLARSKSLLRAQYTTVPTVHYRGTTARGSGNRRFGWRSAYYTPPCTDDEADRGFPQT